MSRTTRPIPAMDPDRPDVTPWTLNNPETQDAAMQAVADYVKRGSK